MMKYFLFYISYICLLFFPVRGDAAEWQWSVKITGEVSSETQDHPQAFLWIPPNCENLTGVVVGCHNMLEEPLLEHPVFRAEMEKLGLALIWVTPGIDPLYDVSKGAQERFDEMFSALAAVSGYEELVWVPVVPIGHSAYASYPWNYAAWNPERTLAVLSLKGDSPRTHLTGCGRPNVEWGERTIGGIPGLFIMGEYEWWMERLQTSFDYRREYPQTPISLLADAGHGHFDLSDDLVEYLALFLRKAVEFRITSSGELLPVEASRGWLAPCWVKDTPIVCQSAPYADYKGNKEDAFWYFDEEMVKATYRIYALAEGKKQQYSGIIRKGKLLPFNPENHAQIMVSFMPEEDGVTFHLSGCFTDSSRLHVTDQHARTPISLNRICGPVKKLNDTTFVVSFYRMGMSNHKRTGDIWLVAENIGDEIYKSAVQQLNIRIPLRNESGEKQVIDFPVIENKKELSSLHLEATASSGLPVYYYVKEGPAEIRGDWLYFTPIPPKAKYPVKVTIVAWQYGRATHPKIQSAEPVERTFFITK